MLEVIENAVIVFFTDYTNMMTINIDYFVQARLIFRSNQNSRVYQKRLWPKI